MSGADTPSSAGPAIGNYPDAPGAYPDSPFIGEDAAGPPDLRSLSHIVKTRRAEYTRRTKVRVKIGSWNVAALSETEDDLRHWFRGSSSQPRQRDSNGYQDNGATTAERTVGYGEGEAVRDGPQADASETRTSNKVMSGGDDVDIYVLGLQEIVDVTSPSEALRPYVDPAPSIRWKRAVEDALPAGYKLVSSQQLVGLLLLIYASPPIEVSSVSSAAVGTGLMGYMGNKGGVATRIVVGGTTTLVFVNCHLAAGAEKASLERRNWDAAQVFGRSKFDLVDEEEDIVDRAETNAIGQEDFAFCLGDLNYRLDDIPGDDVRRLLHLHTGNEYGSLPKRKNGSNSDDGKSQESASLLRSTEDNDGFDRPSTDSKPDSPKPFDQSISLVDNGGLEPHLDPASLETTLSSLLPHDQLRAQQRSGKAFHEGWREANINFLPTYKYDVGSRGRFDSSEKQRSPSWCDRIIYRTHRDYLEYKSKVREAEEAKRRDEEMKSLGLEQEAEDDNILFDYDPDLDGANNDIPDYDENADTAEDAGAAFADNDYNEAETEDTIQVLNYTSHQDIVSSDHKPLQAEFLLTIDAVIPELKAQVRQNVVRELDKAENESRPGITVVVERPAKLQHQKSDENRKDNSDSDDEEDDEDDNDPNTVSFGLVEYDTPISRSLTLANTGCVPAIFSFQSRSSAEGQQVELVSPSWLHLRVDWDPDTSATDNNNSGNQQQKKPPNAANTTTTIDPNNPSHRPEYTLPPGESVHVELILWISDHAFAHDLSSGKEKLDDVLVLRVRNGQDYFIPVHGRWKRRKNGKDGRKGEARFGVSLENLPPTPEQMDLANFQGEFDDEGEEGEEGGVRAPKVQEVKDQRPQQQQQQQGLRIGGALAGFAGRYWRKGNGNGST
ncbi:hypothetical protein AJ80_08378 [Polytolypa hystricis UAMH7299]|uniref:Inositol polyphosphate-related phosphatase domain-containing protein n=1 Tax=Polytolypa hystricis (strain UAMH7299) TaxID=1447883 RepID=A0A2B7X8S0_POLH7|nr:hypothetical protein AJ80_08378 [Polytolypa hystricis UAMH7299]